MTSCQFSSVIGCSNATANPQQVVAKLHCFDLLWTCWRLSICCTTSRHVEMLWICCRCQICCGLVVQLSICCGLVVQLSICCGLVVQLVVQQVHNKSNTGKWSLTFKLVLLTTQRTIRPAHRLRYSAADLGELADSSTVYHRMME